MSLTRHLLLFRWPAVVVRAFAVLSAGRVPVVAFEHGAVGERLSFWEVGDLVPPDLGADGLADAVVNNLGRRRRVPDSVVRTLPQLDRVARKYLELYKAQRAHAR